jgi:integrase
VASYRRAIKRACRLAKVSSWPPSRLRHTAATRIRKRYGIELARIILGHSTAFTTEIYAETDRTKAKIRPTSLWCVRDSSHRNEGART